MDTPTPQGLEMSDCRVHPKGSAWVVRVYTESPADQAPPPCDASTAP